MKPPKKMSVPGAPVVFADFFAGAGGLSEGMAMAGLIPLVHVEANPEACQTLRTRVAYRNLAQLNDTATYRAYVLGKLTTEDLHRRGQSCVEEVLNEVLSPISERKILKKIDKLFNNRNVSELDVLVGGPPCQPFSIIARRAKAEQSRDARLRLFRHYAKAVSVYRPKCFLFENVPGLLSAGGGRFLAEILEAFVDAGYDCKWSVVDASGFGVLQQRRRLIILGRRKNLSGVLEFPEPVKSNAVVNDLLADLPRIEPGEDGSRLGYSAAPSDYLYQSGIRTHTDVLTQHLARIQNARDRAIYRLVATHWAEHGKRLHCRDLPRRLRPKRSCECFRDRFKVVAADMPYSHTVIAHIANDGHYYIHPDVEQARSLSIREAARLQSFPDSYFFEGSRRAVLAQIGNAVPPLLAKAFGLVLRDFVLQTRHVELRIPA